MLAIAKGQYSNAGKSGTLGNDLVLNLVAFI